MQCLNTSNKEVAALLKEYTEILGSEDAAYYVLSENNGYGLDRAPNGAPSKLFSDLLTHFNGDRRRAIAEKAKSLSKEFKIHNLNNINEATNRLIIKVESLYEVPKFGKILKEFVNKYGLPSVNYFGFNENFDKRGHEGFWIQTGDSSTLSLSFNRSATDEEKAAVTLHELVHSKTFLLSIQYRALKGDEVAKNLVENNPELFKDKLSDSVIKAFDNLVKLRKKVIDYAKSIGPESVKRFLIDDNLNKRMMYFMDETGEFEIDEFISEVYSNPALINFISTIPSDTNGNIFSRLTNCIKNILGINISSSILSDIYQNTETIFSSYSEPNFYDVISYNKVNKNSFSKKKDSSIPNRILKVYNQIMTGLERRIADVEFSKYKGNRENELRRLQFELNRAENDKATLEFIDYMADDIIHQLQELQSMRTAYNNYKINGTPHGITQDHLDIIRKGFIGFYSNLITNIQDMLDDPTTFEHFKDKFVVEGAKNSMRVTLGQFNEAVRLFNGIVDSIAKDELIKEAAKSGQWTVDEMNRIIDEGDFDINWWDRYIGQSQYVNNPMIQLLLNKMITQKNKVYDETLTKGKEILDALSKVAKSKLKYLWEKDEKGRKTGYLASSLNRGKHRQDFIKFKQELAEELGYPNEDLEGLEDKLTDEQYKIWSQRINEWDAKHTERRFLPEYYEITNTLSLEAKRRRDDFNNEIQILLLPTVDEDGNFHRELLSDEDYVKLENLENQRRNLANNFYPDGTEKLGLDKQVAEEFQEYNKRLRDRLNYKPNVQKFAEAYRHAKRTLSKELFKKWLDRNTVVRITDAFYEELQKLGTGAPKSDLQVELEEARRQLLKLYMNSEGNIDTEAMPIQVKQMIVDYDDMIKQEALSNRIPGVKSKIWQIATWEVNPEYESQLAEAQRRGGEALEFWLNNNTVQTENGIEPASFWKRLVPKPEFRKYYMERIPNRSWSEIDKESPLYNPNFDESYGEARIPKKSLYENKDWSKIENDPQLKNLYDSLFQTMSESVGKINFLRYANPYRLPQIEGNAWTQIAGSDNVLKGLGYSFMSSISVKPEDEIYTNMTKALRSDGSAVKLIPTRYIKMLDNPNLITEDIVGSVIHFYKMASNYQRMSEIAPEMETILDFASRMEIKKKGSGELLDTKSSRFYNKLNSLVNDLVYGEESNPMNFRVFGKEISFDKIARALANYTRKVGIAHNLNVILTGLFTNKVQNRLTAIEGIYFNNAELWAAASILKKSYYNAMSNLGNANNKNKTLCFLEYVGVVRNVDETFRDLQRNRISRALNQHFWYFGHEMTDYVTKGKTVIAVALHSKYDPTEGKFMTRNEFMRKYNNKKQGEASWKALTTTLYDAFEVKNNKLVVKDEYKDVLDEYTLNRFRNTCKQIGTKIDTQLTDLDRSWVQQNAFGRLIFIYRNWLLTWFQNKVFTKPQFNIVSGMFQDSQFHAAYKAIQTYLSPTKLQQLKELYKENFDEVSEYNKAALRRTTVEFITAYILSFIISAIFSAIASDDKDDFYKNEIALIAARAGVELRSNVLPLEGFSLIQNPSAAWGTLQYFWDMINIAWNDPTEKVRSGPYKGMKRYQRSLIKATPLRSIYEAQDPRAKLQYYENFILFNGQ